jgi:predicted nucleotidyltransferase
MQTLASILFKDYRQRVLGLLLLHPEGEYHVREIARKTNTVAGTLHRELKQLADVGILSKRKQGNQVLYAANLNCSIFEELVSILRKNNTQLKINELDQQLKPVKRIDKLVENNRAEILSLARKNGVRNVRVFGSMARNTANKNSDLDLLVDLEEGKSGFAMGGFLTDVSNLVHRKVDVVTENSLYPTIKNKVLQEAVQL